MARRFWCWFVGTSEIISAKPLTRFRDTARLRSEHVTDVTDAAALRFLLLLLTSVTTSAAALFTACDAVNVFM